MGATPKQARKYTLLMLYPILAGSVDAHCVVTVAKQPVHSAQQPLITTEQYARPLGGITIDVYRGYGKDCSQPESGTILTLVTDAHGQVVLPKLRAGGYYVRARANPNFRDYLCLEISDKATANELHKFRLELSPYNPPATYEQIVDKAEHSAAIQVIPAFRGVITDPSGAFIPGASVNVVFKGTQGKKYAVRLRSDELGRFSANLAPGAYIAFFRSQGFKDQVIPLTVSSTSASGELRIRLNLGDVF